MDPPTTPPRKVHPRASEHTPPPRPRHKRRSGGDCFSAERTGAWVWQEADIHGKSGGAGGEESRSEAGWRRLAAASAWDPATWETAAKAATDRGDGDRPGSIRVISYNVWFERHRQEERHSALFELMAGAGPDLICIQEATRIFVEQLLAQPFARGYVASGGPDGRSVYPYGVFILARPYLQPRFWKHTLPTGMDRSLLVCDISIAGETASIGTVHLESLSHRQLREDQMDIIFPALAKSPHSMLVGDFNFSDGWPENACLDSDYVDGWLECHPGEPGDTMPANLRFPAWRPDHMLCRSATGLLRIVAIAVIGDAPLPGPACRQCTGFGRVCSPSDHFGLCADVAIAPAEPEVAAAGSAAAESMG